MQQTLCELGIGNPIQGVRLYPLGHLSSPEQRHLGQMYMAAWWTMDPGFLYPYSKGIPAIFSALFFSPICTSMVLFWGKLSIIGCSWVCSDSHIRSVRFTTNTNLRTVSPEFHTVVGFRCPFELKFVISPFLGKKKSNFAKMYPLLPSSPLSQCHIKFTGQKKEIWFYFSFMPNMLSAPNECWLLLPTTKIITIYKYLGFLQFGGN